MRGMARLLSANILLLLATSAWAQTAATLQDTTPCGKVMAGRVPVPDDFSLTFRNGPTHASWGGSSSTTVTASGLVTIKSVQRSKGRAAKPEENSTERQISKQAVMRLYASVLACRFFELDASYWNKRVMDGSVSSLEVTAGGKKHNVVVHHYPVDRFRTIVSALNEALEK